MTGKIINLDSFRPMDAKRSVADTLREVARQIDIGEIKPDMIYIAMREIVDGGEIDYIWSSSTHSRIERVGLLARHLHLANTA